MATDPSLNDTEQLGATSTVSLRQLASLGCKLVAVWVFAQMAQQGLGLVFQLVLAITNVVSGNGSGTREFTLPAIGLVMIAGPVAAGLFLWFWADRLAVRMVAKDALVFTGGPSHRVLLSVGLVVAGVALAVPATRDLTAAAASAMRRHTNFADWWHDTYWVSAFCSAAVGLGISAWLVFGSRGLVRLIVWARTPGAPVGPPAQAEV